LANCGELRQFQLTSRILVVDDVPDNLKLVRIVLSRQGFEVHTAATAEEALEMARKIHPRLILADIRLPDMDGFEMTRRLKADPETMDIVVVALTALAMEGGRAEGVGRWRCRTEGSGEEFRNFYRVRTASPPMALSQRQNRWKRGCFIPVLTQFGAEVLRFQHDGGPRCGPHIHGSNRRHRQVIRERVGRPH